MTYSEEKKGNKILEIGQLEELASSTVLRRMLLNLL